MSRSTKAYAEDLAYIHHVGFGEFAEKAAPGVIAALRSAGVVAGRVCDLGCGSGILAKELVAAGYEVEGIDYSAAMVKLARRIAPGARFRRGSFLDQKLADYDAITAVGEVFNYVFEARARRDPLPKLFKQLHRALRPGGVLAFDLAGPQRGLDQPPSLYREGDDWAIAATRERDDKRSLLTRHITTYKQVGKAFRRTRETHVQRLYEPAAVVKTLRAAGFRVRRANAYGDFRFPRGLASFVARRP